MERRGLASAETWISENLKQFTNFANFIDFEKLQWNVN